MSVPSEQQRKALNQQLINAVYANNTEKVQQALEAGADPNINISITENGKKVEKFLLDYAVGMNNPVVQGGEYTDSTEIVKLLLNKGAKPNGSSSENTPLNAAITFDLPDYIIKLLLDKGADPNKPDSSGLSPLVNAVLMGNFYAVNELLTRNNTNIHTKNKEGKTQLDIAIDIARQSQPDRKDIEALLQKEKLFLALRQNDVQMVEAILKATNVPFVNAQGAHGWTPLNFTIDRDYGKAFETLLANGANPNIPNKDGWTPLAIAVQQNKPEMVAELIKHGAEVDFTRKFGTPPTTKTLLELDGATEKIQKLLREAQSKALKPEEHKTLNHCIATLTQLQKDNAAYLQKYEGARPQKKSVSRQGTFLGMFRADTSLKHSSATKLEESLSDLLKEDKKPKNEAQLRKFIERSNEMINNFKKFNKDVSGLSSRGDVSSMLNKASEALPKPKP